MKRQGMHVVSRHTERGHIHRTGFNSDVWFNELLACRSYYTMYCVLGLIATPVGMHVVDVVTCTMGEIRRVPYHRYN